MSELPPFHLAMFARNLDETIHFYTELLGAKLGHRSSENWVNIHWFGHQLTFHEKPDMNTQDKKDFHWGFNVSMEEFEALAEKIKSSPELNFEMEPTKKDEGTDIARIKMYFKDPSGNLIEVKHFFDKPHREA